MDITVYLPDETGTWAKEQGLNLSGLLRAAVEAEKERAVAREKITAEGFERIETYDSKKERDVAFQGRRIANSYTTDQEAYLTPKGAIVITDAAGDGTIDIFEGGWSQLTDPGFVGYSAGASYAEDLMIEIAGALGEKYTEELDI